MLRLLKKEPTHEEVFLEHYSSILSWARTLTKGDKELTEDIVQDAFIQFTVSAPPLHEIQNLDGYLYILLKNLCLANIRRNGRNRLSQLSIFEYDSAEFAFSRIEYRDQEQAREELQKICSFLTVRKEQARTAGVFILRFFHGYFPSEIARILRTSRPAVDVRLLEARREIRSFLENPNDVKFIGIDDAAKKIFQVLPLQLNSQDEFLERLRSAIFKFSDGEHQSKEMLARFYENEQTAITVAALSHLVSCVKCLEEVNLKLHLPNLSTRFPTDAIRRDKKKDNDSDDDSDSGGTKGESMLAKLERQARLVFEHKPKELRVAVNGNFQGTLKVNSDLNEIDLAVADKEPVEFIEIYSEQQLRLLFVSFDNSVPHPKADSTYHLRFSDERFLRVNVVFSAPGAEIRLIYQDPTYKQVQAILEDRNIIDDAIGQTTRIQQKPLRAPSVTGRLTENLSNSISLFSFGWRGWAIAALTVLITVGGWMFFERQSSLSAKAILEESEKKKLNWQYQPGKILYWEEEEKLQNSQRKYLSKRWANNLDGQHERLILRYNDEQKLIWGKWIKADGTLILYDGKNETATVFPSASLIREKLPTVKREHQQVLQKHLDGGGNRVESDQQIEFQTNWMIKNLTSETVRTHKIEGKETICVLIRANGNPDEKVKSTELEVDYDKETFQRILYRYQIFHPDGTSAVEEARLITARESNSDEFENNELARFLATGKNIKTYSVEEFAENLRSFYFPAKK